MYLTVHGATAMLIAKSFPHPLVAFFLGLLSHFLLDFIPHGDEYLIKKHFTRAQIIKRMFGAAVLDALILLGFLAIFMWVGPIVKLPVLFAALVGSLLPDALQGLYFATEWKWLKNFQYFHVSIHNPTKHPLNWSQGIMVQCLILTAIWLVTIF